VGIEFGDADGRVSKTLRTIIADINLAEMERRIPIILISNDPWYYLPPKNSLEFGEMQKRLSIVSVIDRNNKMSYEELLKSLVQSTMAGKGLFDGN
jgi:hypothetical protein